ncbi:lipid-A-disaccharide synthase [Desulfurivibrio alkaliphilus]|uniref:Lipid-A-disaccharide synthase n=1 Tax=Desulfurivibrio alkaliphilus (strain DSM 19089 / UNIQEM U267 / AHT2) TaxID=589865 RepID=D6Z1U0_DESAT|nr:lipid-A-disaccharide synthase [Desulfurivibrio alkaliphilus]ADH85515.1 lipid-A-disaccharide synthase [Desulfurivibrio alkaliphilus AHT 2]
MSSSHVLIVAGEASGDMHGANLVRALRSQRPGIKISAMGGSALAAECELIYDSSRLAVVGLVEVLGHLGGILAARRRLIDFLKEQRPDLLILIDYPDFNLLLAAQAKKLGIRVLYYISPQVWAWRRGRVAKIKRLVDRMAVILPFEQEFYRRQGLAVDFVGHPLVDELAPLVAQRTVLPVDEQQGGNGQASLKAAAGLGVEDEGRPVIGLVPGSRRREVAALLPVFLAAADRLAKKLEQPPIFLLPMAPGLRHATLQEHGLERYPELDIRVSRQDRHRTMAACDAAMAASGTVTLELAILGVPTVAAYRVSTFTYLVGRLLVKVPYVTLVNLVAKREVIPELIQHQAEPATISREIVELLTNQSRRRAMLQDLAEVRQKLGGGGASQKAAELALSLLN